MEETKLWEQRKELTMNRPGERLIGKVRHAQATANGTTRLGHGATREGALINADACPDVMKSGVNDGTANNEVVTAGETAQVRCRGRNKTMKETILSLLGAVALVVFAWAVLGLIGIAEGSNDEVTRSFKAVFARKGTL